MLKLQPLVTTGAALCLVLPAAVLGDGDLSSLTKALRETERALDVLRGIESGATRHTEPGALLRSVTEAPIADGPQREADLERLRNEVGLLQTELDVLDAQALDPSAPPPANLGGDYQLPAPALDLGVTTGLTPAQRTALFGDASGAEQTAQAVPTDGTTKAQKPQDANAHGTRPEQRNAGTEAPGYSADPVRHASTLYRAGRYQEGFALIATRTEPDAVVLQARFLEKLGRTDEAIAALESVVDKLPEGYESRRAKSDLEFFRWKRDFLKRLPETPSTATKPEAGR